MYESSTIKLASSYDPSNNTSTSLYAERISEPKTQYTALRRLVGTKRDLYGENRLSKTVGLVSRKLFG